MNVFLLALLAAVLALILERGLAGAPLTWRWHYRWSFLLGTGLAWLAQRPVSSWGAADASPAALVGRWLLELGAASLGAFTGCLWATAARERLWEDNAPPPAEIQAAVRKMHQQAPGSEVVDPLGKRIFDLLLALFGLLLSTPVWLTSLFLVWFEDPGPVLFVKNSVGRGGKNFHQYKIRSIVREAEQLTGPVLSQEGDERVLWIGRLLRKTALDEIPQLLNILGGEMSFVGPRPQRTVLVYEYLQLMPEYSERHRVRPGLAGLAQVAGDYFLTPRQKLRFDRLYIQHASLGFDLKLIFLAFLITFGYRWKKNWNGRIPRRWLHGR